MTKNDLLATAKSLGIKGRHEMSKADLETAVAQRQQIEQVSAAAKEAATEIKGKTFRRRGSNLNTPWQRKYYYVSMPNYQAAKDNGVLAKAPMQVQLMLKFMVERGIVSYGQAQQGSSIASVAVSSGFLRTKIEPHVLFAYYRAKMELLGLVFAGYNLDEDPEAQAEAADAEALEDEQEDEAESSEEGGE